MSSWTLIRAELWRRPERTVFTVAALAAGFFLFGLLQSVNAAFSAAVARSHADRLMIAGRFGNPLPLGYLSRIEGVLGVKHVAWLDLLPARYRDPTQPLMVIAASPGRFFSVLKEYEISAGALERLIRTRAGIIVLDTTAKRFGWKVGDQVSLISPMSTRDGGHTWIFDVVGIATCPSNPTHPPFGVVNYTYFDANRVVRGGTVAWFYVQVADARRAASVGRSIDRLFANSSAPTFSQQESEFAAQGVSDIGDVRWLTDSTIMAVFFAMIFLTANVVFESVRERIPELAVLKTVGYSATRLFVLIELEALVLCISGAIAGLGLAAVAFHFVGRTLGKVSSFLVSTNVLSPATILAGVSLAVALTLIAAAIPAWSATRLDVGDALRVGA